MTVESVTYINDLEPDRPRGSDRISQGDDHIRNIKKSIKQTFPKVDGEVKATDEEMNYLVGLTGPIKDEIDQGANDISQLQADVATNTANIGVNASAISANIANISSNDAELADHESRISANTQSISSANQNKADKTYVDQQNAAQDGVIATKADKSYVNAENASQNSLIAAKADKSYVDQQNAAQDTLISKNSSSISANEAQIEVNRLNIQSISNSSATKSYVDQQNAAQDGVIATKANKSYVNAENSAQDAVIATKASNSDVAAIDTRLDELEIFVRKGGGSMIKPVEQPASVGQFAIKQGSYSKPATDDIYYAAPVSGSNTVTFSVPAGKVFVMDYLFALGYVDIGLSSIKIDGVTMMPSVSGVMQFDSPADADFDFAAWPTPFSGASIRVEQSVRFTYYDRNVAGDAPEVCISGLFVEA